MVTTGAMVWSDSVGAMRTEELVFAPLQLARTTATFLIHGFVRNFGFLAPLDKYVEEASKKFRLVQFQCVCDSATANCKALPHLFSWLKSKSDRCVSSFTPCMLHQLSRILVMNLERQGICSVLPVIQTLFPTF